MQVADVATVVVAVVEGEEVVEEAKECPTYAATQFFYCTVPLQEPS